MPSRIAVFWSSKDLPRPRVGCVCQKSIFLLFLECVLSNKRVGSTLSSLTCIRNSVDDYENRSNMKKEGQKWSVSSEFVFPISNARKNLVDLGESKKKRKEEENKQQQKKARDILKRRISRRGRGHVRYYLKRLASRLRRNERNSDSRSDGGMSGRTNGSQSILEACLGNRAGKVHERDPCESAFRSKPSKRCCLQLPLLPSMLILSSCEARTRERVRAREHERERVSTSSLRIYEQNLLAYRAFSVAVCT